jgi:MerR family transcriptional regulator, light-induced transcriptional regulator
MSQTSDMPIFNLKAVVQETGLKPDTLRAWERRYNIPQPHRTESGHRLYTQHDINILKWLIARQSEGLSISRAVALWHKLEQEEGDPLAAMQPGSSTYTDFHPVGESKNAFSPPQPAGRGERITALHDQWVQAALSFDEQAAGHALSTAFALFTPELVCTDIIQKGLATIGEGWHEGRVTVQQEHFASALAIRRLESLLASTPQPTRPGRILVGCPPEEAHTFVPLMLSLLLRRNGWNVLYLGADIPVQSFGLTIKTTSPTMVILTAQQLHTAATLLEMAQVLAAEQIPLGFGGMVFNTLPSLHQHIPGYFLGTELAGATQVVAQVMLAPRIKRAEKIVEREYIEALHHFQERRASIEADVWRTMEATGMPQRHLASANTNFGRSILAALALGNMSLLGPDIQWVQSMLITHFQLPAYLLHDYLEAYLAAARDKLGAAGYPIVMWLTHVLSTDNMEGRHSANDDVGEWLHQLNHKGVRLLDQPDEKPDIK